MNTKEIIIVIFGALSLLTAIGSFIYALRYRKNHSKKSFLSALQVFTIGIYISVVLQYIPVYYKAFDLGDKFKVFRPLFLALYQSLRVFLLEAEYDLISGLLDKTPAWIHVTYSLYAVLYFVLAPALTAGFVLSMFDSATAELKLRVWKKRPVFIMSKLNDKSVVLARSIREHANQCGEKVEIIFADVVGQEDEEKYELQCEVQESDIHAICVKKDVTQLNLKSKKGKVKFFLIGDDESENIGHAIQLTELYKNRANTHVYVYASSVGSGHIIDSLDKGQMLISPEAQEKIMNSTGIQEEILFRGFSGTEDTLPMLDGGFKISRVDSVDALVLDTFRKCEMFELCRRAEDKVISILIVGMGNYGKQILKTALWFCQADGYKLEITVVDGGQGIRHTLAQECPEIISMNPNTADGDSNYDIRFFENVDCFTADFDHIFESMEFGARLKRTKMAFVTMGDDDKNIEAAIMLRKIFDRLKHMTNADTKRIKESEYNDLPMIYSVVYDDKKAENLNVNRGEKADNYLVNYKGTPYHIHFIGSLTSLYSYEMLSEAERMELDAFRYHIDWVKIEKNIRDEIYKPENAEILRQIREDKGLAPDEPLEWGDSYLYDDDGKLKPDVLQNEILGQITSYMKFEYFKNASNSKAVHKNMLLAEAADEFKCLTPERGFLCTCKNCERRRKTEHMRWNAYMRVNGYIYGSKRSDRGLVHPDLRSFDELDVISKYKD